MDYKQASKEYLTLYKRTRAHDTNTLFKVATNLYMSIYQLYEASSDSEQVKICNLVNDEILSSLVTAIQKCKDNVVANKMFDLYQRFFALSSRRILSNMALYIESKKTKKIWDKTLDTMAPVFYYASKIVNDPSFILLRISCQPGLGKSYLGNLLVANLIGNDKNITILRITFSDDLVKTTTKQTKSIIESEAYEEIFPRYAGKARFKSNDNYSFVMSDCEDENQFFSVTRDGQATGKRAKVIITDDLLKGELESSNTALHGQIKDRYDSDWSTRADDDQQKTCLLGTMWAYTDLLNVLLDRELNSDECVLKEDKKFKHTLSSDASAFIGIPALDENGESTCPNRFSTKFLLKKRDAMSPYLWSAVYQQNPIAPDGLEFTWANLNQYEKLPKTEIETVYASLDPARRGKNYVSMPVFKKFKGDSKYYLSDFLYKKKSMKELYDGIVDKIINNHVLRFVIENNTDTSLKEVIEMKLKSRKCNFCTITEKYSTQNKESRIKDHQGTVKNEIMFPKKSLYPESTDMGKAMASLTSFSFDYPNKFDDAIDSVVLFVQEFIDNIHILSKPKALDRNKLGI